MEGEGGRGGGGGGEEGGESRWIKESVAEQENTISADMGSGRRTQLWLLALLGCSIVAGVSSS